MSGSFVLNASVGMMSKWRVNAELLPRGWPHNVLTVTDRYLPDTSKPPGPKRLANVVTCSLSMGLFNSSTKRQLLF